MAAKQLPLTCSGHTRPVVDLAFSGSTRQGFFLISACKDGKPMLRKGDTGDWLGTFEGHKGAVWGATLNKGATQAATAAADFTAKLWNSISGEELATFTHKHIVKSVDFSQDEDKLLTGSNEKKMRIFDLGKIDAEPQIFEGLGGNPKSCLWGSDRNQLLSGGDNKCICHWDVRTSSVIKKIEVESSITGMEIFRPSNILTVTYGKTAAFYDLSSLELIKSYTAPTLLFSASLHPNKECFVAGGDDFLIYKFDYETGNEIESYKGHFGPVHCIRFSPDGELYSSGSEDGTLRLWQTTVGKTYGLWKSLEDDEKPSVQNNSIDQSIEQNSEVSVCAS